MDTAATSSFWQTVDKHIKTGKPSNKQVCIPIGLTSQTSKKAIITNNKLNSKFRQCDLLTKLAENSLFSVCKLADMGYITAFHSGNDGVTVHWRDDIYICLKKPAILQGWRDASGIWRVTVREGVSRENFEN